MEDGGRREGSFFSSSPVRRRAGGRSSGRPVKSLPELVGEAHRRARSSQNQCAPLSHTSSDQSCQCILILVILHDTKCACADLWGKPASNDNQIKKNVCEQGEKKCKMG